MRVATYWTCLGLFLLSLFLWIRGFHARDQMVIYYSPEAWGRTIYLTSTTGQLHFATFYAKMDQHFITLSSSEAIRESCYHKTPFSDWWYSHHNHKAIGMYVHVIPTFWLALVTVFVSFLLAPSRQYTIRTLFAIVLILSLLLVAARTTTPRFFAQLGDWMPPSDNSAAR